MAEGVFTVRIAPEKHQQLDALAHALDRSRNCLVSEAIDHYLAVQAWHIVEIQAGLAEAERGELLSHAEVLAEVQTRLKLAH